MAKELPARKAGKLASVGLPTAGSEEKTKSKRRREVHLGLVAVGSAGPWYVNVDETIRKPYRWFAQIEGPLVSINLEIQSPSVVGAFLDWVEGLDVSAEARGESKLGELGRASVLVLRDDEFEDRFFLLTGTPGKSSVRLTLAGQDLRLLMEALSRVREELRSEGLV